MATKLQGREAGTREAWRIVYQEIAKARVAINGKRPSDTAIHGARKSIKKARALWRLLQRALPAANYRQTNTCLRDAGRPLGTARDAKILVAALDRVLKEDGRLASARAVKAFRRGLIQNANSVKRTVKLEQKGIALSRRALRRAYQQTKDFSIGKRGWSILGHGLQGTYARGRRSYHKARSDRDMRHLHEWRKQVKYLHHQFGALKPLWRGPIGKLGDATGELSELLGDDHDLAVLRARVAAQREEFSSSNQQARILAVIDRRRRDLENSAFVLGARVYEEKPVDFAARFGGYWHEWRRAQRAKRA
jgi:CHAD domain-containing protein